MASISTAARLFRRHKARQWPAQPDFADYGTAFGLELSMAAEVAAAPAPTSTRDLGFWRRLASRRSAPRG